MSLDVCVEGLAQRVEYYATDEIQGTQCAPLADAPPEATIVKTSVPEYLVDEMFEPGVFWFQTGPPTSLDDETGQTRGQTCLPDYLEPDAQLEPSDVDWQNPTTLNDAVCTFPMYKAQARTAPASGTTHTATLPDYVAGDGVLILLATSAVEELTPPSGWGVVFQQSTTALTTNLTIAAYWRVMDGTEGATVDVTSATTATLTFQAFSFTQVDPYTGPDSATNITSGANDNPPSLTHDWPDQKTMWVMLDFGPDNTHTITNVPLVYRAWGLFGFPTGGANQYVMAGLRQLEAATEDPNAFTGAITSSATATIAIRGLCYDGLNDDPAGCSVPSELEPETQVDCYGWQSQGPGDDPNIIVDDPDTGRTSVPDWLEPQAEPSPDDVTFGWQRQSLLEEDYQPGEAWTAVTEPQENVFDYSTDWWIQAATIDEPALDVADETTISTYWPDYLEPEAEPLQDGWQKFDIPDAERCVAPFIVESVQTADGGSSTVSHTVNLPTSPRPGSLLIVVLGGEYCGVSPTYPAGWTEIDYGATSSWVGAIYAAYRLADGTEPTSITVTTAVSGILQATSFEIDNWDSASAPASANGTSTGASPGTEPLTSGFGLDPTLWINALGFVDLDTVSSYPTGFDYYQSDQKGTSNRSLAIAARQQTIATQPANAFAMTGDTGESYNLHFAIKGACLEEKVYSSIPDWLEPEDTYPDTWVSWPREDQGVDFEAVDTSIPADLEPEAQVDTEGWRCAPLQDLPTNPEIVGRSVPDNMEPEPEVDAYGWRSAPLHDTPSTDDITGASVPETVLPGDQVGCDGWAFRLPDMEAAPVAAQPEPPSTGTLPGHAGRKRWWLEGVSQEEAKRRKRSDRWPDLKEPQTAPPWKPKVVTNKTKRPRLSAIDRDWKEKLRKSRKTDDMLIATIIAMMMAEDNDGSD